MTQDNGERPETQSGDEHGQNDTNLTTEITQKCVAITEKFRSGVISKVNAFIDLQRAIPHDESDPSTHIKALEAYIRILDNFKRLRINVGGNGGARAEPDGGDERDGEPGDDGGDGDPPAGQDKRHRSHSVDSSGGSPTKRKIDVNAFAWVIRDEIDPPALSPSLAQTQASLENFSRDLKLAKVSLLNSPRLPQFPDTEWTNLLSGRAVDLDHVLAGQYSISQDDRRTERIGEIEFIVGSIKPDKTVNTHGKWLIAWDQAVEATTYIFPHRALELREYGKHITQLFTSFPDHLHTRIIQYDRAVRIRAAQRRNLLLTDYAQFGDLHVLWIQNAGGAAGGARDDSKQTKGSGSASGRRREPCRRWNEGRCPNTVASCNFAHVCSKCRSNAHTADKCDVHHK